MKKIISYFLVFFCLIAVNWSANALTYTVNVPDGTPMCFIAGGMNGWNLTEMDRVDGEENQFTITYPSAQESDEYKYWSGPSWNYEEAQDADGTPLDANRTYSEHDVVAFWMEIFYPNERTVTIEVWTPMEIYVLYIVGSFNSWSGVFDDTYKMNFMGEEDGGKVFEISISSLDADNMEFKFVAGPDWAYEQADANNWRYGDLPGADTDKVSFALALSDFKNIFDPTKAGNITITATVPDGTERVWVQGSFIGWNWNDPDAMEMTKQEDGTFTYTVANVEMFDYRLYNLPDWGYPEVGEEDPTAELPNRKAVFADTEDGSIEITVWGWMQTINSIPIISNDSFIIYPVDGQIIVNGAFSKVDVFDLTGHLVQSAKTSGAFTSKVLKTGMYIIRVDGVSKKMIVK